MTDEDTKRPLAPEQKEIRDTIGEILSVFPPQVRDTLRKHLREILAALIIIVLATSLFYGYSAYTTSQENKAAAALGQAVALSDPSTKASALEKVVQQHKGTTAGKLALLLLGAVQRDSGHIEGARESFKKAKQELPSNNILYYSAVMGLAYLQEDDKKLDEAGQAYKSLSQAQSGFEAVAALDLARVSSATGHNDEAIEAYNRYLALKPQSSQLDFVHYQLMKIPSSKKEPGEGHAPEKENE